ncbi:MAG: hypothetical protein OIN90_12595 [Candidatus Methanoperedens sp.]|nr:hypothetical protein [Candidatus Methanoperedens sp.]
MAPIISDTGVDGEYDVIPGSPGGTGVDVIFAVTLAVAFTVVVGVAVALAVGAAVALAVAFADGGVAVVLAVGATVTLTAALAVGAAVALTAALAVGAAVALEAVLAVGVGAGVVVTVFVEVAPGTASMALTPLKSVSNMYPAAVYTKLKSINTEMILLISLLGIIFPEPIVQLSSFSVPRFVFVRFSIMKIAIYNFITCVI